jgi:hypothetical protein
MRRAHHGNLVRGDWEARRFINREFGSGSRIDSVRDGESNGGKKD